MSSDPPAKGKRGVRLGKYQVVAHIATGGMGAVYKARDVELGREVALKVLPPEVARKHGMKDRFEREARSAGRLHHENIVTLYEFGKEQGTRFIAFEFIDGVDLHDYIRKKGKLDPEAACEITRQAALALDHANKHGLVHRDVKPSNFLLTRKDGKLLVKMTDFGLARARETDDHDEESRITKAGTTVGTVDYISPEQARDSGSADIRSDIYSLGCTLYHMLGGQPPFPDGSVTERLFKHIGEEPEDVGRLNPKVPEALRAVLRRMMAKKPEDRYQTPAKLLRDLAKVDPHARPASERLQALASLADMEGPPTKRRRPAGSSDGMRPPSTESVRPPSGDSVRPASGDNVRPPSVPGQPAAPYRRPRGSGVINRVGPTAEELSSNPVVFGRPVSPLVLVGGVLGVCALIAGAVFLLVQWAGHGPRPKQTTAASTLPAPVPTQAARTEPERPREDTGRQRPAHPPEPGGPPRMYTPVTPIDAAGLRQELEAPWAGDTGPTADTPVYAVSRAALLAAPGGKSEPPTGLAGVGGGPNASVRSYASLADACAAVPPDRTGIIEVRDNGPLFLAPAAVTGRNLVLRAGKGYRPLLVWDLAAPRPEASGGPAFVAVTQGSLTLENLNVAVRWAGGEPGCFFRVTNGDFVARDCVFSVAGGSGAGVSVVRLEGMRRGQGARCRLTRCFARGGGLVGIDLRAPGGRALLDGCLLVGGDLPLLQVHAHASPPSALGLARCTLVGRQTLLELGPAAAGDDRPAMDCTAWDCVLARCNRESGGELVGLAKGATPDAMHWRAVNTVYAGWANLLRGPENIAAGELLAWHRLWRQTEGDKALTAAWPPAEVHDAAEVPPGPYSPDGSPVGFAASAGPGIIGCEVSALPPARDNWLALTYDRFVGPSVDYLSRAAVPAPPADDGQAFAGARLNLNQTDLGAYLDNMVRSRPLAPQVVLYLSGSGERRTRPVRVKGSSLVLVFEPPAEKAEPLTLTPGDGAAAQGALVEVEDGNLDLVGGNIRFPDFKTALMPPYLIAVRGGNLRLHDCRLQGPTGHPPEVYRALVRFAGSGKADPDKANVCAVSDSQLLSGGDGIEVAGTGARVGVQGSVVVCGQDAVDLQPGGTADPRLNVQAVLDHTTVAARRAVVREGDAPGLAGPVVPAVVQSTACAFLNPFVSGDSPARAGMLLADGDALPRGLLLLRSDGDLFDKRLYYQAAAGEAPPEKPQPHALWAGLWGPAAANRPVLDVALHGTLDLEHPQLDRLALPALPRFRDRPVGADLVRLGILKK